MRTAGMPGAVGAGIAFLLGVLAVQWLPTLPPAAWGTLPGLIVLLASRRWPSFCLPAIALLGAAWAIWRGALALDLRLPRELEGRDFEVVGTVTELPLVRSDATRFVLDVEHAALDGRAFPLHGRVRLNWYNGAPRLPACS